MEEYANAEKASVPTAPTPNGKVLQVSLKIANGASISETLAKVEGLGEEILSASVGPNYGLY